MFVRKREFEARKVLKGTFKLGNFLNQPINLNLTWPDHAVPWSLIPWDLQFCYVLLRFELPSLEPPLPLVWAHSDWAPSIRAPSGKAPCDMSFLKSKIFSVKLLITWAFYHLCSFHSSYLSSEILPVWAPTIQACFTWAPNDQTPFIRAPSTGALLLELSSLELPPFEQMSRRRFFS